LIHLIPKAFDGKQSDYENGLLVKGVCSTSSLQF